jgi:uncharacterized membrane protein
MLYIIGIIVGLYVGAASHGGNGFLLGAIIGVLVAYVLKLKDKVQKLEKNVNSLTTSFKLNAKSNLKDRLAEELYTNEIQDIKHQDTKPQDLKPAVTTVKTVASELPRNQLVESLEEDTYLDLSHETERLDKSHEFLEAVSDTANVQTNKSLENEEKSLIEKTERPIIKKRVTKKVYEESLFEKGLKKAKSLVVGYFTGGNSLVRTGLLVLFVGVAFLLKYVAERTTVPIEFRYIGISLGCLVMLVLGWKLRVKRPGYGLSLLGGGIGVLYLTLFSAMRLHGLISPQIVIILLIAIVMLSAVLAILTNSMALAVIGMIGGYSAPILTSTGSGSYVQLFSYYLLLNLGVFVIAWFKSWRILNVLGFIATFGIGSLWGYKYYVPEFLWTIEPFLIINFLLYTAIAILFATKQPPNLKGLNDGTLIFGTPLVGFSLQAALMKDMAFGLAYSALILGAFYIVLSYVIHKMNKPYFKHLIESFIALGIGFATLAIPLGFDGRVTSAMWVAEGSALVWVGIRQAKLFPRFSGYALTLIGSIAFFTEKTTHLELLPWLNADYIGVLIIAAATAFIGIYARKNNQNLLSYEVKIVPQFMLVFSLVWWLFGGIHEITQYYNEWRFILIQLFLTCTSIALLMSAKKLKYDLLYFCGLIVALGQLFIIAIMPTLFDEMRVFLNSGFIGLMVISLYHFGLSWFCRSERQPDITQKWPITSSLFLTTSLMVWFYAFVTEIRNYFPINEFLLIELLMAVTVVSVLLFAIIKNSSEHKIASVVIAIMMIFPMSVSPHIHRALPAIFNVSFLGYLTYSITQLCLAWYWQRKSHKGDDMVNKWNMAISHSLLFAGLIVWFARSLFEIYIHTSSEYTMSLSLTFIMISILVYVLTAHKLQWKALHLVKYLYLPMLLLIAVAVVSSRQYFHDGYGLYIWVVTAVLNYWLLFIYDKTRFNFLALYHIIVLFLFTFIVMFEGAELVQNIFGEWSIWHKASYAIVLIFISTGLYLFKKTNKWPISTHNEAYIKQALPIMVIVSWLMMLALNLSIPGNISFIPYLPLVNPIDITAMITLVLSGLMLKRDSITFFMESKKATVIVLASLFFLMLNASMLRCFHYWYGLKYSYAEMFSSTMVQTGFSILWALTAVVLMVLSARKKWRAVWLVGLGLIIVVVIKLFLVDMSASGSIERIVAFLTVGILLSVVGYFSPLPPDDNSEHSAETLKEEK